MKPERAAQVAETAANDAVCALELATKAAREAKAAAPPPPDPRTGPFYDLLRREDGGMFARMSPRRNRWPELEQIDHRIAEADQEQARVLAELHEVQEWRRDADGRHQLAIADWFAAGQPEPRPVSEAAELDERIGLLQAEHASFDITRERLFEQRVAFVVKRRDSLVRDAEKATQERLERCLWLVDELEQAREDLVALRQSTVWARLYPSEALASEAPFGHALVGARLSIQERHIPGSKALLPAVNVFALLRADAEHCAAALTVDQAAAISGATPGEISGKEAVWQDRKFELDRDRREKKAAIERYTQEWGRPPSEWH